MQNSVPCWIANVYIRTSLTALHLPNGRRRVHRLLCLNPHACVNFKELKERTALSDTGMGSTYEWNHKVVDCGVFALQDDC